MDRHGVRDVSHSAESTSCEQRETNGERAGKSRGVAWVRAVGCEWCLTTWTAGAARAPYISSAGSRQSSLDHLQAATPLLLPHPQNPLPLCSSMGEESSVRRFVQDVPAGAVHQVIPGAGMIHPSMGALLAGFGMASAGIFLPGRRPLASAVYGAGGATTAWNGVAMAGQDQTGGGHGERALAPMHRGPWTDEEDE
jgi:hypothetical protein